MSRPNNDKLFRMHLALACSRHEAHLELHIEVHDNVWMVPIAISSLKSKAFLCLLYAGVHFLLDHNIYFTTPPRMSLPFKDWSSVGYKVIGTRDGDTGCGHVFSLGNMIYKFYDSNNMQLKPNVDLIKAIGESDQPYLATLTVDVLKYADTNADYPCGFLLMRYERLKGKHHSKHFSPILYTLQKIHDQKYVHGDIRHADLVFNEDGINSWIINFDMAAKNGKYCDGYAAIHMIEERHPDAIQGSKMKVQHDCHSLAYLMKTVDSKKKFDDIISAIKDTSEDLRNIASHIIELDSSS